MLQKVPHSLWTAFQTLVTCAHSCCSTSHQQHWLSMLRAFQSIHQLYCHIPTSSIVTSRCQEDSMGLGCVLDATWQAFNELSQSWTSNKYHMLGNCKPIAQLNGTEAGLQSGVKDLLRSENSPYNIQDGSVKPAGGHWEQESG